MGRIKGLQKVIAAFSVSALLMVWACHLDQDVRTETYFNLSKYADTLDEFDSIRVEFMDTDGNPIDSAYRTKEITAAHLAEMPVPHYQGDSLRIRIIGWKDNRLVYDLELGFDGAQGKIHSRNALVLPGSKLELSLSDTSLTVGDSAAFPGFTISPPDLASPKVEWESLDPERLASRSGFYVALSTGSARLRAWLKNDTAKSAILNVSVLDTATRISIAFQIARLDILLGDTAALPEAKVLPSKVSQEVDFRLVDSTHVRLAGKRLEGISVGDAELIVSSRIKSDAADTLPIRVYRPAVASLGLLPDTVRLYTGGKRETLQVKVEPPLSIQAVRWRVTDTTLAVFFKDGILVARKPGRTHVTALSEGDSTRHDSSLVLVKRDMPQLSVGRDTAISVGGQAVFSVSCSQEFGEIVEFRTDLDGDSVYEKTYDDPRKIFPLELKQRFDKVGDFSTRFYLRDSEGNDTVVVRHVKAVLGPVININSPRPNSYTNKDIIDVEWTVNDLPQSDSIKEFLKLEGANKVIRTAKDAAGKVFQTDITVYRDQTAPDKPKISGPAVTRDRTPTWNWKPAEAGGAFRYRVDTADLVGAPIIKDTAFNPPFALSEGKHIFYLQERDLAGNWSALASFDSEVDLTPPKSPIVASAKVLTNSSNPTWTWLQGGGGSGAYRYKIDDSIFISGSTETSAKEFIPATPLAEGGHTLFVQERDIAGNWSGSGYFFLTVDTSPPGMPKVNSDSGGLKPKWTWKPGGGGLRSFRIKLDDSAIATNPILTTDTAYIPNAQLSEGSHVLYVQELDAAGNWSATGSGQAVAYLPVNTLRDLEISEGFEPLFDGTRESFNTNFVDYVKLDSTNATLDSKWKIDLATNSISLPAGIGTDVRSVRKYRDFDLRLDYRNDGQQGISYRGLLTQDRAWMTGVEFTIKNDTGITKNSTASAYDLYAPSQAKYKLFATGEWNSARIVVIGDSVEHWLNGSMVVGYKYHSESFWAAYNTSKWVATGNRSLTNIVPGTQVVGGGYIQDGYITFKGDHGGKWQIRNLRINSKAPKFGPP